MAKKRKVLDWALAGIGVLYLLNLGLGIGELIPDITPVVGNLDELLASWLVLRVAKK